VAQGVDVEAEAGGELLLREAEPVADRLYVDFRGDVGDVGAYKPSSE
jgi:hypothetical protein